MAEITIDDEFKNFLPSLTDDEYESLKRQILANGKVEPLTVWSRGHVLVDGHKRRAICQKHQLPFDVDVRDFDSRADVLTFIAEHQSARRNGTPELAAYLRGWEYGRQAGPRGGDRKSKGNSCTLIDTAEDLAKKYKVSPRTIKNDAQFASRLDTLVGEFGEYPVKDWVLRRGAPVRRADVGAMFAGRPKGLQDAGERRKAVELWQEDGAKTLGDAIRTLLKENPIPNDDPPLVWEASWDAWLPTQPDCDLLLTDPPYMTDVDDIGSFAAEWLPVALEKVKPTGRAYVFVGAYPEELRAYLVLQPPEQLTLESVLVWTYRNTLGPSSRDGYNLNWQAILYYRGQDAPALNCAELKEQFAVQDVNAPDGRHELRYHAWQKPDELAERLLRHATQVGELVLDPFCGTGTFVLAANRLGRVGRGCDVSEERLNLATSRGCQLWKNGK